MPTGKIIKFELDSLVGISDIESIFYLFKHPKGSLSREDSYTKNEYYKNEVDNLISISKSYFQNLSDDTLTWTNAGVDIINNYNKRWDECKYLKTAQFSDSKYLFFFLISLNRLRASYKNGALISEIKIKKHFKLGRANYKSEEIIDKRTKKILRTYRFIRIKPDF